MRQDPNFRTISKPNKTSHEDDKKIGPALRKIIPQKRTINGNKQMAPSIQENIGKIVQSAKEPPHEARRLGHPPAPLRSGLHPALPAPKRHKKTPQKRAKGPR